MPSFIVDAHRALELRTRMDRLVEAASVDTLTGLPNRRAMGRALGRLKADDVVIMLDLDHFKRVNDTLGHAGGDQVLSGLGHALQATVRGTDLAGRFGGEEFLIVLSGTSDPDAFLRRLRVIWSAVRPSPITFSAGIALAGEKVNQAVGAADQAMYRAKESGRDQWAWALPDEYSSQGPILRPSSVAPEQDGAFVAFSQIHVPEGGAARLKPRFTNGDDAVWDHSVFSKNRDRLLEGEIAAKFMAAVLTQPNVKQLLSTDHFSVDGTLVEAWASMKSLKPKTAAGGGEPPQAAGAMKR